MKYFTFDELEYSYTARVHNIDNRIPESLRDNARMLVDNVLDPLREAYGKPIKVTSGYRCAVLNNRVGGAVNSHHMRAMAADIVGTPNTKLENMKLFDLARALQLPFTQLIDERKGSWVHISYDKENTKREVLYL